jgi:hypothetical protein
MDTKSLRLHLTRFIDKSERTCSRLHLVAWSQHLRTKARHSNLVQGRVIRRMRRMMSSAFDEWAGRTEEARTERQQTDQINKAEAAASALEDSFSSQRDEDSSQLILFKNEQRILALRRLMRSTRLRLTARAWRSFVAFAEHKKGKDAQLLAAHRLYSKVRYF